MRDVKVGDVVYPAYRPRQVGRVIEVECNHPHEHYDGCGKGLKIRTLKGEVIISCDLWVRDFVALVDEHKRKYDKHRATLDAFNDADLAEGRTR